METKLVIYTTICMAVMLSIVYFSLSFIASIVHQCIINTTPVVSMQTLINTSDMMHKWDIKDSNLIL